MRILIDLQGAQTSGSRHRGIGRYSLSFAEWILRGRGEHHIDILLNGAFPETITPIRDRLAGLIDESSLHLFYPVGETRQDSMENLQRRLASELIREGVIASLRPDLVHVTSHFEGYGDSHVSSFKRLDWPAIQSVTLYDLIPYIHQETYLRDAIPRRWYEERLLQLRRADLLLGISSSSAQEAIDYLGFPEANVVNVGTAADPQFGRRKVAKKRASELRSKYGLRDRFIMYTGGIDHRKNIERLIAAFGRMEKSRSDVSLAIVCSCHEVDRRRLSNISRELGLAEQDVVLTGFVPEEDLVDFYNLCELFVFPSWHEGFGLPALEAMHCGAPVIGSNRSSLPEVIGSKDAQFDPFDDAAIAGIMDRALTKKAFRSKLIANSKIQAEKFSWKLTADKAIAAFEEAFGRRQSESRLSATDQRPRLAYFAPIPPAKSGIADYSAELLPELSRHYEIELIVPTQTHVESRSERLRNEFRIRDAEYFLANSRDYDRVLYHLGNSDHHGHMLELAGRIPGVIVLHDFFLSGMLDCMENVHGITGFFTEALFYSHGFKPLIEISSGIPVEEILWKYPANRQVIERGLGVIVHSEYSRHLADRWLGSNASSDWTVVPLLRARPGTIDHINAREKIGIGDEFLICSFGGLGVTKSSDILLNAYLNTNACRSGRARLVFVGIMPQHEWGKALAQRIKDIGADAHVSVTGWADHGTYKTYLESADAAVQLRTLSRGETSAAALDCLNYGIPTIVNANGSMADLPRDSVIMLDDEFEEVELSRAIDRLFNNEELRARLSNRGRAIIQQNHDPRRCADSYRKAIERFYCGASTSPLAIAQEINSSAGTLDLESQVEAAKLLEPLFARRISQKGCFIDISAIENELEQTRVDAAICRAAESLLAANIYFEVVALTESGTYSTRRREALSAFGVTGISLDEYAGRLAAHDVVKVLVPSSKNNDSLVRSLLDLFIDVEIHPVEQPSLEERLDAVAEFQ